MVQQFAPNEMKEFVRMKPSLLQKSKTELDQIHSTMFVRYICGKAAAASLNIPSTSSNTNISTGKRSAPQISPLPAQNIAAKVRRTENNSTAVISSSSSSLSNVQRPQTISQSRSATTFQTSTNTISQMPSQLSLSASVSKTQAPSQSRSEQNQQQRVDRFAKLVNEYAAQRNMPKTAPPPPAAAANNSSTSDDDIMIIGETKKSSSYSKTTTTSTTSTQKSSSATNLSSKDKLIAERMKNVISQSKPPQSSSPSHSRPSLPTLQSQSGRSRIQAQPPSTNSQSRSNNTTPRSNLPSTSTMPNLTPAALAQFSNFQNSLVQQQLQHLLQNSTPQNQQQIFQAYLATLTNNQQQQQQPPSSNQKR
uniref:Uncharacterized protein n=1 Tax=Panagrolaimus davidi TaxID=227884 RepID=A0A914QP44_9BILA